MSLCMRYFLISKGTTSGNGGRKWASPILEVVYIKQHVNPVTVDRARHLEVRRLLHESAGRTLEPPAKPPNTRHGADAV